MSMVDTQTAYFRFGEEVQLIVFPGESLTRIVRSPTRLAKTLTGQPHAL